MKKKDQKLIQDYFESNLNREEVKALEKLLLGNPKARSFYRTYAAIEENLFDSDLINLPLSDFEVENLEAHKPFPLFKALVSGFAALLILGVGFLWLNQSTENSAPLAKAQVIESGPTPFNAKLVDYSAAVLMNGQDPNQISFGLGSYSLASGSVHLRIGTSVDFIFQGPGSFEILGPKLIKVIKGKTRTVVNDESGHEFTILTKQAKYVDLGTEFCLDISEDALDKVDVQAGEIEVLDLVTNDKIAHIQQINSVLNQNSKLNSQFFESDQIIEHPGEMGATRWLNRMKEYAKRPDVLACFDFQIRNPTEITNQIRSNTPLEWRTQTKSMLHNRFVISKAQNDTVTNGIMHHASWAQGRWPDTQSLLFHNKDSHVGFELKSPQKEISLTTWVRPINLTNPINGILCTRRWTNTGLFRLEVQRSGILQPQFWGEQAEAPFKEKLSDHWQMLSLVVQPQADYYSADFYLNEKLLVPRKLKYFNGLQKAYFTVGNCASKSGYRRNFGGFIDELILWNRPLDAIEIAEMYQSGIPHHQKIEALAHLNSD